MWLDKTKNYSPNGGLMVIYHARNKRKGCPKNSQEHKQLGAISSFSPLHLSLCTLVDTIQRQPHRKRKQTLILGSSTGVLVGIDVHKYISTAWAVFGILFKYIYIFIYIYQISPCTWKFTIQTQNGLFGKGKSSEVR